MGGLAPPGPAVAAVMPEVGVEPTRLAAADFESAASTAFATRAAIAVQYDTGRRKVVPGAMRESASTTVKGLLGGLFWIAVICTLNHFFGAHG